MAGFKTAFNFIAYMHGTFQIS